MTRRALFLAALFLASWGLLTLAAEPAAPPPREPLIGLPLEIGEWRGRQAPPLDERVLKVLGADDYLTRIYSGKAGMTLGLYIGYHASQRQDDSIHSPMNCLPGAGWVPGPIERLTIPDRRRESASATINRVTVQKGEERQLVLYWYQSQGRVVASEYASKAFLFLDAARTRRSDAALVRILCPAQPVRSEQAAQTAAQEFAVELLPLLGRHIPE